MRGLGTIINVAAVIAGSMAGMLSRISFESGQKYAGYGTQVKTENREDIP